MPSSMMAPIYSASTIGGANSGHQFLRICEEVLKTATGELCPDLTVVVRTGRGISRSTGRATVGRSKPSRVEPWHSTHNPHIDEPRPFVRRLQPFPGDVDGRHPPSAS